MSLSALKGVRTRFRNTLATGIDEAYRLTSGEKEVSDTEAIIFANKYRSSLKNYIDKLETQMYKVTEVLEESDPGAVDQIIEDDCDLIQKAETCLVELEQYIEEKNADQRKSESKTVSPEENRLINLQEQMHSLMAEQIRNQAMQIERQEEKEKVQRNAVKLPKLELCSFNGDKLRWTQFWDAFECTVHNNRTLSPIEKFNYLQSKVVGDAKRAISGLSLSNDNYGVAVSILKERFGNTQEAVDLHYRKLINIQAPSVNVDSLRTFIDTVERHLRSLEVLSEDTNQPVFISIIRSKLPSDVLKQLELSNGSKTKWTVHKLREQVREYIVACEHSETKGDNRTSPSRENKNDKSNKPNKSLQHLNDTRSTQSSAEALTAANTASARTYKEKCRYCKGNHWSDECPKFKTVDERKKMLQKSCYKCLKEGHKSIECKSKKICVHCGEMNTHHRSLCVKKFGRKSSSVHLAEEVQDVHESDTKGESKSEPETQGHALISADEMVLMQTARTTIHKDEASDGETARVLLDSGSQRTYITEELANKLGLKPDGEHELKLVTFGSNTTKVIKTKTVSFGIKLNNGSLMMITANVVPTISGSIQRNPVSKVFSKRMEHLINSVDLADTLPIEKENSCIDVLLGNDYYLDVVLPQRIELEPGLYLLGSKLGWILTGRTHEIHTDDSDTMNMFVMTHGMDIAKHSVYTTVDASIPDKPDLQDFWNIESIGITDDPDQSNDEIAMQKFKDTLKFEDGRYQVTWPWKEEDFDLPTNRPLALGRLKSTLLRMSDKPDLLQRYDAVIEDQLQKGVIEKVTQEDSGGLVHYIPHHAVVTPQKTSTKLRVVYDASAKSKPENKSLNECLYRGPVILQHICGMLLRFRLHNVVLIADIEKAFLQIGLQPHQRDVTRFLWIKDRDTPTVRPNNIQEYRFTRVPFGVISSPFLLGATVQSHMDSYKTDLADQVKNDIYVDNLITGTKSEGEAICFYKNVKDMFTSASMNLREWVSNSDVVNNYIPSQDKANPQSMSVLGLSWNPSDDTIALKPSDTFDHVTVNSNQNPTKRSILKDVSSHFDPLGLYSPVLLRGKLLIQRLWTQKKTWDEKISDEDTSEWNSINSSLIKLHEHRLQRCITSAKDQHASYSLVCFCDASGKAYSVAVYLHECTEESSTVNLVFSKSRLAPVKAMTIPRLEIMAVVIGVRCLEFVQTHLRLPIQNSYLYTDSQCVLQWIVSEKDLPVFIRNRVREIKTHQNVKMGYVNTSENPADLATRGTTLETLVTSSLWWHGPKWLQAALPPEHHNEFINVHTVTSELTDLHSQNETVEVSLKTGEDKDTALPPFGIDSERFSTAKRMVRVTAWCLRFVKKLKGKGVHSECLGSEELKEAEKMWVLYIQKKQYADVFSAILGSGNHNLVKQLDLCIDQEGLLRCGGRLSNADLTEEARHPILLPQKHQVTSLLIDRAHKRMLHCGVSQTLGEVRQHYWIPHGRATVRKVIRMCKVCERTEGGPYKLPPMAPLPSSRVSESIPFVRTGLDYLGPLYVKDNKEFYKVWVCLFTCLVTRAVHLEIVQDMSAKSFLNCLRRFIATRGAPSEILSDNARQFKLSSDTVRCIWINVTRSEDVQDYVSGEGIKWTFIVELAPWMGGFYERLVGLVKRTLRKTLGRKTLTFDQMSTVIKEAEAVVNSRPLVYLGSDLKSTVALTPRHFLCLNPFIGIPETDCEQSDPEYKPSESSAEVLVKIWKKGEKLLNTFWKIWRTDYLLSLRERTQRQIKTKRVQSSYSPNIGDVVLVKDDIPRGKWKMGRVLNLRTSQDGNIRSAEIQTSTGSRLRRPLNLLYPIEVSDNCETSESKTSACNREVRCVPEHSGELKRPQRTAAIKARKMFKNCYN